MKKVTKKQKKETTLDDLATMVAKGFAEQGKNLNDFKTEMYGFKSEMLGFKSDMTSFKSEMTSFKSDTEASFNKINKAISEMGSDIHSMKDRINNIDKVLGPLLHVVDSLKFNWRDHDTRITRLEKKILNK
jgi:predicted  nucleic acid-binding Zn-ribbon protein